MSTNAIVSLNLAQVSDLIEESQITQSQDLGAAVVHIGSHPQHGNVVIVSTVSDMHAMIANLT